MNYRLLNYLSLFGLSMLIDRMTKLWAVHYLHHQDIPLFTGLNLTLVFNRGISWGMLQYQSPWAFWVLTFVVITVVLAFLYLTMQHYWAGEFLLGETIVLAGASSNIVDRFIYGGVVDFIHISWPIHWPVFNIADSFIVVGIGLILYKQWSAR